MEDSANESASEIFSNADMQFHDRVCTDLKPKETPEAAGVSNNRDADPQPFRTMARH